MIQCSLAATAILAVLPFRAQEQVRDSLYFALVAQAPATNAQDFFHLFNPHHLLYIPATRLVYLGISSFCGSCDAVLAGQL